MAAWYPHRDLCHHGTPRGCCLPATSPRTFTIHNCLGRGGFGEVYLAEMHRPGGIDTEVALKVLRRDVGLNSQAVQRLRDEGRLLARLSHPAILKVHDLLVLDGRVALVTEYVDGKDLSACFEGSDPITLRPLLEVIAQVAGALDNAWTAAVGEAGTPLRMVHRDVKPSNIRIGRRGAVKLLDFGIARTDEMTREAKTMTDMLVGSPPYMAPERFLRHQVEPASDVFALGAVLAEGLTGEKVFDVPVTMLAGLAVSEERYADFVDERLDRLQEKMPAQVFALLRSMLAYDTDDRPTAKDVSLACERLADRQAGPSLRKWAKEHDWGVTVPADESGDLDGREILEGTMEDARTGPRPATLETLTGTVGGRAGLVVGGMSLMALGGAVAVLLLTVGLIGLAWWQLSPEPVASREPVAPAPVAAPVEAPKPETAPVEAPEAEPEPPPEPEPTPRPRPRRAQPEPAPEPVPIVVPAPPPPRPAPAPVAEPTTATVSAEGSASRLVRGSQVVSLPGEVPAGSWDVQTTYGDDWVTTKSGYVFAPGERYTVRCGLGGQCRVTGP